MDQNIEKNFQNYIEDNRNKLDIFLSQYLASTYKQFPILQKAIMHSVFSVKKRLRPLLLIATTEMFGQEGTTVIPIASSIELVHVSSCILDDLPSMDNSSMRDGKASTHKVFGEAATVLVAVSLLSSAYSIIANSNFLNIISPQKRSSLVSLMSNTITKMASGQLIEKEKQGEIFDSEDLKKIYTMKSAVLFESSVRFGAICGSASEREENIAGKYAKLLGIAYQLADDIKDDTYIISSIQKKRLYNEIGKLMNEAKSSLNQLKRDTSLLLKLGEFILNIKFNED